VALFCALTMAVAYCLPVSPAVLMTRGRPRQQAEEDHARQDVMIVPPDGVGAMRLNSPVLSHSAKTWLSLPSRRSLSEERGVLVLRGFLWFVLEQGLIVLSADELGEVQSLFRQAIVQSRTVYSCFMDTVF